MNRPSNVSIAAIVLLLGVLATFTLIGNQGMQAGSVPRGDTELAELARAQAEILRRLDRLEESRRHDDSRAASQRAAFAAEGGHSQLVNGFANGGAMSAAELKAHTEDAIRKHETAFFNEPRSAAWADRTERMVERALDESALAKEGAVAPMGMETTCHSQTCRISISFADATQGDFTKTVLLQHVVESLPVAEIYHESLPDGSVEYRIYARKGS